MLLETGWTPAAEGLLPLSEQEDPSSRLFRVILLLARKCCLYVQEQKWLPKERRQKPQLRTGGSERGGKGEYEKMEVRDGKDCTRHSTLFSGFKDHPEACAGEPGFCCISGSLSLYVEQDL